MSKDQISKIPSPDGYGSLVDDIGKLLEQARRQAVRAVNSKEAAHLCQYPLERAGFKSAVCLDNIAVHRIT